jgi:hypothetical protein
VRRSADRERQPGVFQVADLMRIGDGMWRAASRGMQTQDAVPLGLTDLVRTMFGWAWGWWR